MEALGRGVVALHLGGGKVFVSWRLLGTDPDDIAFDVYRNETKVSAAPLTKATCLISSQRNCSTTSVSAS